jgi:hypothetical protein
MSPACAGDRACLEENTAGGTTMSNQMIGIAAVFVLSFFLLAVRYCLLSLGRSNRNRPVNPALQRGGVESNPVVVEDDSWLLWSSDTENEFARQRGYENVSHTQTQR